MDTSSSSLGSPNERAHGQPGAGGPTPANGAATAATRRPQTLMTSTSSAAAVGLDRKLVSPPQNLTLTIHKDSGGYGMKVSGDNPVYVESAKAGGAAQKAGLLQGDMILMVNGTNVRYSTHTLVVQLIKSSTTVELTVQRNYKMQPKRPASAAVGPTTPVAQRGGIGGPVPVDSATSHELKMRKIETLQTYLERLERNLENLKSNTRNDNNRADIKKAEQTIKSVQQQLQMQYAEDPPVHNFSPITVPNISALHHPTQQPQHLQQHHSHAHQQHQQQHHLHHHHHHSHLHSPTHNPQTSPSSSGVSPTIAATAATAASTPAFLSRFPRSLSSISLGTKKKSAAVEPAPPPAASIAKQQLQQLTSQLLGATSSSSNSSSPHHGHHALKHQHPHHPHPYAQRSSAPSASDVPPPLPQRNMPRNCQKPVPDAPPQISDLDQSAFGAAPLSPGSPGFNNNALRSPVAFKKQQQQQQRGKALAKGEKALSDPKVSSQLFIDMEQSMAADGFVSGDGSGDGASSGADKLPPPLPPRQPGMMEEKQLNALNNNSGGAAGAGKYANNHRPLPNSLDQMLAYPLSTTTQAVRDNFAAFPLSHRPNVQQILQQQQQMQQQFGGGNFVAQYPSPGASGATKATAASALNQQLNKMNNAQHRRHASSPAHYPAASDPFEVTTDDRHQKSSSGTWDMTAESMPADGTPPPRYSPTLHHHPPLPPPPPIHHQHQSQQHRQPQSHAPNSPLDETSMADGGTGDAGSLFDGSFAMNMSTTSTSTTATAAAAAVLRPQPPIISMEEDEMCDEQDSICEDHGPYRQLHVLLEPENVVFSAVFLNFVLSNSTPSPLLFYMITGLYIEGNNIKDMRKWAYEIHSTFLVPGAPLLCIPDSEALTLAGSVDTVLQSEHGKIEMLRAVFRKGRNRAKEHIARQLEEFKQKRTAGLGTMFGPSDGQLCEAKGDKVREQRVFEETLLPRLQQLVDELERDAVASSGAAAASGPGECPKKSAMCSALSTVLHRVYMTGRTIPGSPIDRVHHYVSREKSFRTRLMNKTRKTMVLGHNLQLHQYHEVTNCNHCQDIIWGVSPQGYQCANCGLNIHRSCSKTLRESCPLQSKTKGEAGAKGAGQSAAGREAGGKQPKHHQAGGADSRGSVSMAAGGAQNKMTTFFEKIFPQEKQRRQEEEWSAGADDMNMSDRPTSSSVQRQPSDRRADPANLTLHNQSHASASAGGADLSASSTAGNRESGAAGAGAGGGGDCSDAHNQLADSELELRDGSKSKSAPVSVNRSESYKERLSHRRSRNSRRKTSDPSFSKSHDDQGETTTTGINNATYPASSNSSLSSSIDSPSVSMEVVSTPTMSTIIGAMPTAREWMCSDDEAAGESEADWSSCVPLEMLQNLSKSEKERQEIINEIYQTERNHVRTLKLLEGVFFRPLQESGALNAEHIQLLFPPALLTLRDHHSQFEQQLKQRRIEQNSVISGVGDLLLAVFGGRSGDELKENAAHFCARQQIALEALKEKRRKDDALHRFLTKAESHKACRRLQLKDLLPTALQRLTKYPLLFESLYTITLKVNPDDEAEAQAIRRALDLSRRILDHVNQAVREAEDAHKLQTIQKKLDRSSYDKEMNEYKNLDLTQHKLLHDGLLISKKNPGVQLHGLLFENIMVLLQKLDDKYILKYHTCAVAGGDSGKGSEARFNPISKTSLILGRNSAVDKNIFFLINQGSSQMMELTAPSSSECKTWVKHISDAADAFKIRAKYSEPTPHPAVTSASSASNHNTAASVVAAADDPAAAAAPATLATGKSSTDPRDKGDKTGKSTSSAADSIAADGSSVVEVPNSAAGDASNDTRDQPADAESSASVAAGTETGSAATGGVDDDATAADGSGAAAADQVRLRIRDYSSNSNNTRTLTQQSSLVAPSEVQVSCSPALKAEPVLTLNEKLRRFDESIRVHLAEKQKIVCDMFRVPNEHFTAIADIVSQPEAPKDPADVVLALFAQVQSLNEIQNQFIQVSPHQEVSAVSTTTLCDDCHQRRRGADDQTPHPHPHHLHLHPDLLHTCGGSVAVLENTHHHQHQHQHLGGSLSVVDSASAPPTFASVVRSSNNTTANNNNNIHNPADTDSGAHHHDDDDDGVLIDDDGYCEIDELRMPTIIASMSAVAPSCVAAISSSASASASTTSSASEAAPAPAAIGTPTTTTTTAAAAVAAAAAAELKRQSTISADSIPEETDHEMHAERLLMAKSPEMGASVAASAAAAADQPRRALMTLHSADDEGGVANEGPVSSCGDQPHVSYAQPVITTTQAVQMASVAAAVAATGQATGAATVAATAGAMHCGVNRLAHVTAIAPAVPCYLLHNIVTAMNAQLTLLLPKLQERDAERDKLRKEVQHLRELVHSLHERDRVSTDTETPNYTADQAATPANSNSTATGIANNNSAVTNINTSSPTDNNSASSNGNNNHSNNSNNANNSNNTNSTLANASSTSNSNNTATD